MKIGTHSNSCGHFCCLRIQDLSVKIGNDTILSDINMHIHCGELVALIGPNGAGKSSTIKILSGILVPDSGNCIIDGRSPWKDRVEHVRQIGVVFGQRSQLWWDIPVIDSFELLKEIYSIATPDYKRTLEELTELLQLQEILRTPTRQLSLGQRMRCEIAASLLHNPKLLFLDEPTIGLDAVSKLAVREFIKKQNAEHGTTVILTTHDMQDIEAIANRVILIGKGRILLDGTLEDMRKTVQETEAQTATMKESAATDATENVATTSGTEQSADDKAKENLDQVVARLYRQLDIL